MSCKHLTSQWSVLKTRRKNQIERKRTKNKCIEFIMFGTVQFGRLSKALTAQTGSSRYWQIDRKMYIPNYFRFKFDSFLRYVELKQRTKQSNVKMKSKTNIKQWIHANAISQSDKKWISSENISIVTITFNFEICVAVMQCWTL